MTYDAADKSASGKSEPGGEPGGIVLPSQAMGLNDNLEFFGKQLHVQTENVAFPSLHIVTQVFSKGRILFSRKSEYPADAREAGDPERMHALMRAQHLEVIQEISDKRKQIQSTR